MAKSISAEQLESLLTCVIAKTLPEVLMKSLEKFEACLNKLTDKFEAKLDKFYGDLHVANVRIDKLEDRVKELEKCCVGNSAAGSRSGASQGTSCSKIDPSLQVLMAVETEKAERAKRQRNVIVTGLPPVPGRSDEETFLTFCEENLTVKPPLLQIHRIGRSSDGQPRKLKICLENEHAVEDLILSSQLLRQSTNPVYKNIYFNRDLTPLEAQLAYEARQSKKAAGNHLTGTSPTST